MPTKYTIEDAPSSPKYTVEDEQPASSNVPQEGFLESLGHTFGIGKDEALAQAEDAKNHPIESGAKAAVGPAAGAIQGAYQGAKRIGGEISDAWNSAREGNSGEAAVHAIQAIPFLGPALQHGAEQLNPDEVINPAEVGTALGTAIQVAPMVAEPFSGVSGPLTRGLRETVAKAPRAILERATGTGPKITEKLVADTQEANKVSAAKHGEALEKHQEDVRAARKSNVDALTDHLNKIDDISKVRQDAKTTDTLRKELPKIINDTAEDADVRIEKARHDALEEGNKKYNAVNPELNPIEADPEFMTDALQDAAEGIKGSNTKVPILEDITKRAGKGDTFNYEDLQGYYSELGREISKGTLPGDVYHAMDTMHEAIGEEMQRIADSKGMGDQLKAAREYWRRMKQTFGDTSDTVSDRAGKELAATHGDLPKAQMSNYRRRLLGSFDPEIPRMLDAIDEGKSRLEQLPKEKEVPEYPAPPEPTKPGKAPTYQPKTVSSEDIEAVKKKNLTQAAEALRHRAMSISVYVTGYRSLAAIGRAMAGDLGALRALPAAVAEGVGMLGGADATANFLQSPKIVKMLTEPTERDLAQIPPELRGDLKPIVERAQKQGIKVDPRLASIVGASAAIAGPQTRKLQELRDGQPNTP